jgi:hypothetical protein
LDRDSISYVYLLTNYPRFILETFLIGAIALWRCFAVANWFFTRETISIVRSQVLKMHGQSLLWRTHEHWIPNLSSLVFTAHRDCPWMSGTITWMTAFSSCRDDG